MRFLLVLLAAAACAAPARATLETVVLAPADDVSLPFLCNWGYDWQERCYRDDLGRLEVGGAGDKVWRSALRFPLDGLPASATVVTARALVALRRHMHGSVAADGGVRRTGLLARGAADLH